MVNNVPDDGGRRLDTGVSTGLYPLHSASWGVELIAIVRKSTWIS